MNPLAFRLKNYAEVEPISGKPFSSKALRQCYAQGAERFGWSRRPLAPRQLLDDAGQLVGWGMGTATFPALMFQAEARAVVRSDGSGLMERDPRHGSGRLDRIHTDCGGCARTRP
jgi:xanthine dehydrogenase YagR molybdenum-binding subunit